MTLHSLLVPLVVLMVAAVVRAADAPKAEKATDAAATSQPAPAILMADKPIEIDGSLDKPIWKSAKSIEVNYVYGKVGVKAEKNPMLVKYAWDSKYLYIGYETFDKNLTALGTGKKQGPAGNQREGCEIYKEGVKVDVVEFFITCGNQHFFWELHHNALNQFNDVWCTWCDPSWPIAKTTMSNYGVILSPDEYLKDDVTSTVKMAVKLKPKADGKPSTVNDPSDEDTGYTAEIRLPWSAIGTPLAWVAPPEKSAAGGADSNGGPKAPVATNWAPGNHQIQILAVMQDGDLPDRYHHSSPTLPGGWFHQNAPVWPTYRMVLSLDTTGNGP